jgi:hypothetical protein
MEQRTATLIALCLMPFAALFYRVVSRYLVELAWRHAPPGRFKNLLGRDRASRRKQVIGVRDQRL